MVIKRDPNTIVTRFAPSPTGMFHVGSIRTTLYNYLFARKHKGIYILRCEDTDPVRSKKEYEENFLEVFKWLGLEHDEYYRQSERTEIYRSYINKLIDEGKAYVSNEEGKGEGMRDHVIRFKNPNKSITFVDQVLGEITFDTTELGDFVIARDFDSPLYHFTVVVDDHEMGVTHIIRGQDHVSNTPRQILIQEAIGAKRPIYAHASMILNEERAKLSKRDPLVRPALEYRDEGYLPDAILNFMAMLGWNPGTPQEIFTKTELISEFTLERMQKPGAIFNPDKLEWFNKEHIKKLPEEELFNSVKRYLINDDGSLLKFTDEQLRRALSVILERINHFGEIAVLIKNREVQYLFEQPTYTDKQQIIWKNLRTADNGHEQTRTHLARVIEILSTFNGSWSKDDLKSAIWDYAEKVGRGDVLWPMRYALSGREKSPDPFQLSEILGKDETLRRIRYVHDVVLE